MGFFVRMGAPQSTGLLNQGLVLSWPAISRSPSALIAVAAIDHPQQSLPVHPVLSIKCSANRIQGPAETLARAKQALAAVSTVLDHSESIGLTVNQD